MVPKNATDPASELIVQLNQTITAQYTSFRFFGLILILK